MIGKKNFKSQFLASLYMVLLWILHDFCDKPFCIDLKHYHYMSVLDQVYRGSRGLYKGSFYRLIFCNLITLIQ